MDNNNTNLNTDINNITVTEKKKGRMALVIYSIVITVVCIGAAVCAVWLFIENNKAVEVNGLSVDSDKEFSAKEVEKLLVAEYDKAYEKAYDESEHATKTLLLNDIKNRMSKGDTTLSLLRALYPEYLIYNEVGGFKFMPILDVPMHEFAKGEFVVNDDETMHYIEKEEIKSHKTIDVSKFQGDIDWKKVKEDGVEYAFIRVGYRGYGTGAMVEDEYFDINVKGAIGAGIKVGVYFFTEAINDEEAIEEAEFILEKIKPYKIELPVVLDVEEIAGDDVRNEELTKEELTNVCLTFMEKIEEEGYTPMLYGNLKCIASMIDYTVLCKYPLWYAFYSDEIYIPYKVAGWQYSSTGKVDGISGDCDLNMFFENWD